MNRLINLATKKGKEGRKGGREGGRKGGGEGREEGKEGRGNKERHKGS